MTLDAYGRDARLIHRRYATYAAEPAAGDGPFVALPFLSFTAGSRAQLETVAELPSSRLPPELVDGLREASGELRVALDLETIGWHLTNLLGAPTTSGSGPYTHVWALGQTPPPFVAFEVGHRGLATPLYTRASGFVYQQMSIDSAKRGGSQDVRFGLLGGRTVKAAATLDADPVERAAVQIARAYQGTISIDGTAAASVVEFSARLSNGLAADQSLINGTPDPAAVDPVEPVSADGNLRVRFRDFTLYDAAKAGTLLRVDQVWSLSASRSLTLTWRNVRLGEETPRVEGAGVVEIGFPWRLAAPPAGQAPLTATLVNGRASYAMPT